jgi:hypothetical protein
MYNILFGFFVLAFVGFSHAQQTLEFGTMTYHELTTTSEVDSFTFEFSGTPGEMIILRMIEQVGSNLQPQLTLMSPSGEQLNTTWNQGPIIEFAPKLPLTGTYKIYAQSFGGEETGAYALSLQRTVTPPGAKDISINGTVFTDTLDVIGEINAYNLNFDGVQGEKVMFRLYENVPSDIQPQMIITDPSGKIIHNSWGQVRVEVWIDMPLKGTYYMLISSLNGQLTGNYNLFMQNSIQTSNVQEISDYGVFMVDTIKTKEQVLTYTMNYNGSVGETVNFRLYEKAPSDIQPQLVIFDPSGTAVINAWGQVGVDQTVAMPSNGIYTFWVSTLSGATSGEFFLYMQRTVKPGNTKEISASNTFIDDFTFIGELHTYEIQIPAGVGENLSITMAEKSPSDLQPQITLFSPSGSQLGTTWGQTEATINVQVTEPGAHTLWVDNLNNNLTGTYELTVDLPAVNLDSLPNLYRVEDIPDDQGGWVNVHFTRSTYDTDTSENGPERYTVEINDGTGWTAVETTVAFGKDNYTVLVPTTKDSTDESNGLIDFRVIAGMEEGNFVSNSATGYSVDNLHPSVPNLLLLQLTAQLYVKLDWLPIADDDFRYFKILRRTESANFELLATTTDTTFTDQSVVPGTTYEYVIVSVDHSGNESLESNKLSQLVSNIANDNVIPGDYALKQNYPNPFNPETQIAFDLPGSEFVTIDIYNSKGQKVESLVNTIMHAGSHQVTFNAANLASGVYYYSIVAGDFRQVKKMVVMK